MFEFQVQERALILLKPFLSFLKNTVFAAMSSFLLTIKTLSGVDQSFEVNEKDTIKFIKHRYYELGNECPPPAQRAIAIGKILENQLTLKDYGIDESCPIYIVNSVGYTETIFFRINENEFCMETQILSYWDETINDLKQSICKGLKQEFITFCQIYDIFYENETYENDYKILYSDKKFKDNFLEFYVKTKSGNMWYRENEKIRCDMLTFGFIRILIQQEYDIFIPVEIKQICNRYYYYHKF